MYEVDLVMSFFLMFFLFVSLYPRILRLSENPVLRPTNSDNERADVMEPDTPPPSSTLSTSSASASSSSSSPSSAADMYYQSAANGRLPYCSCTILKEKNLVVAPYVYL